MSHAQWVRLWLDMPTDPKWRAIAKRAGRPTCEVVAVFTMMMTNAGAGQIDDDDARGVLKGWCDEDTGAALDIEPEHVTAIRAAMQGKVLDGDRLIGWKKRQPKREDSSAERTREWRERRRNGVAVTPRDAAVTHGDAPERERDLEVDKEDQNPESEKKIDRSFEQCSIDASEALAEPDGPTATSVPAARKRARQWEAAEPSCPPARTVPAARRPAPIQAFVSEDALEAVRSVAPGWDRQFLLKRFTEFNQGKHIRAPDKAFLAWVRSFTKGQNLWRQ